MFNGVLITLFNILRQLSGVDQLREIMQLKHSAPPGEIFSRSLMLRAQIWNNRFSIYIHTNK